MPMNSLTLPLIAVRSDRVDPRMARSRAPRYTALTLTALLHLLLAALLWLRPARPPLTAPAAEQPAMIVNLLTAAIPRAAAPAAPAAPAPAAPPRPRPLAKPRPVERATPPPPVAAPAPAPLPAVDTAPAAQATQAAEPVAPAETAPAPPAAEASASGAAATPAAGIPAAGSTLPSLSPEQLSRLERQYSLMVMRRVERQMRIPAHARQFGEKGVSVVRLRLARDGRLIEARIVQSAGYASLDEEALGLMYRIGQFPPVPAVLRPWLDTIVVDQPVNFVF